MFIFTIRGKKEQEYVILLSQSSKCEDSLGRKRMKLWIWTLLHDVHIPFLLYVYNCLLFFFSQFFSLFAYILRVALCSQVLEWKSCSLAAWRGQWEHIIWIPTAAAQTLYWMYKEPSCGHQGIVTTKYTFRIYITHVFMKLLVAIDFYPIILYLFGYCKCWRTPLE